ncbi:MAG: glycosyltransferase family 4 protein [Candidatus Kapabacteria bacterium]|nr:glycosyltransferase family 4 protein [Candidatus Kapabacteria bacterium]
MKILVINWQDIKNPFGGGAEVHMHEIFKRIAAMGHDVTIFACAHPDLAPEEIIDGIKIIRKGDRNVFNFIVPWEYRRRFKNKGFDIIIDDINKIPFYTPLFVEEPLLAISHHFFGKSIFHETNTIFGSYVYLSEALVDVIYKKTKFVVVSDSTLDEFISRGFDKKNITIVTNAIEQSDFPMAVTTKNPNPIVTYFGRLKKYKSVDHLVRAFYFVSQEIPNAKLEFIGRGDFRPYLEQLCRKLGISDKVHFHGFVDEQTKSELLSKSYCVVNTSMKEGWGITNIEANACGTPVISANVPGLRDSVSEGVSGLLYEYGNIMDLADKLRLVLTDNKKRQHLSEGAVSWARQFSWDTSAEIMLDACQRVIDEHKS